MAEAPKNAQNGVGMEGFIAKWYARQTARDIEEFKATARRIAPHIGPSARVLEIAPGPGYLAIEIAELSGCRVIGLDASHTFVRIAAENARKAGVRVNFEQGDAADLPFPPISSISSSAARRLRISRGRSTRSTRCTACSKRAGLRSSSICARTSPRKL